jgi:long-subunit fatty acid transport protein
MGTTVRITERYDGRMVKHTELFFDAGAVYRLNQKLSFGLAFLRLDPANRKNYHQQRPAYGLKSSAKPDPALFNAGAAYRPSAGNTITIDVNADPEEHILLQNAGPVVVRSMRAGLNLGAEYLFDDRLAARAGVMQEWRPAVMTRNGTESLIYTAASTLTLGVGFRTRGFYLDLAAANDFRDVQGMYSQFRYFWSLGYDFM